MCTRTRGGDELVCSSLPLSTTLGGWALVPPCYRRFGTLSGSVIHTGPRKQGSPNLPRTRVPSKPGLGRPLLAMGGQAWSTSPEQHPLQHPLRVNTRPAPPQPQSAPPQPQFLPPPHSPGRLSSPLPLGYFLACSGHGTLLSGGAATASSLLSQSLLPERRFRTQLVCVVPLEPSPLLHMFPKTCHEGSLLILCVHTGCSLFPAWPSEFQGAWLIPLKEA